MTNLCILSLSAVKALEFLQENANSGLSGHPFRIYPDSVPATCGHLADVNNSTTVEISFQ